MNDSIAQTGGQTEHKAGTGLALFGLICMGMLALLRAMVEHDPFPMWDADPFVFAPPVVGFSPVKAIMLNIAVVISGCLALVGMVWRKDRFGIVLPALLALGAGVIAYHAGRSIETALDGSNLLAIVTVLFIASKSYTIPSAQRLLGAMTISFAMVLVITGAYEMFVVHPNMIEDYQSTRDSFLAARGWSSDSVQALGYERRLNQAEPIAWFGLTNVFASFAGACSAGLFMLGWILKRDKQPVKLWAWSMLGGVIALLGLIMTGAKGGFGAFVLVLGISLVAVLFTKRKIDGRAIMVACGFVMLAVLTRGIIGERLGELSLLFRAQYAQGSLRMFIEHPIVGVGPGAFQEHYMVLKPELSPEDVTSAHSVVFDLIAMLGLGGLALIGLFLGVLAHIRPAISEERESPNLADRTMMQITGLCIAVVSILSIRIGSPGMDMNLLLVQLAACTAWGVCAIGVLKLMAHTTARRWALFACAGVLSIHGMLEVTPTWIVSGVLWALMIGQAATAPSGTKAHPTMMTRIARFGLILILIASAALIGSQVPALSQWEAKLAAGAQIAVDFQYQVENQDLNTDPSSLDTLEFEARGLAVEELLAAAQARPTHAKSWIAATQQMLWRASVYAAHDQDELAQASWERAVSTIRAGSEQTTGASAPLWLGTVLSGRAQVFPDHPDRSLWLQEAQKATETGFERTPHNPAIAVRLMDNAIELDDAKAAYRWARVAVELHELRRLDPLSQLQGQTIMRARTIVARGDPSAP